MSLVIAGFVAAMEVEVIVERVDRVRDRIPSPEQWDLASLEAIAPLRPDARQNETESQGRRRTIAKPNSPQPIC
jgi:hypothetical protein